MRADANGAVFCVQLLGWKGAGMEKVARKWLIALTALATIPYACAAPAAFRAWQFGQIPREEKIRLAVERLGELQVGGYCEKIPKLREVVRNPNCCGISRREQNDLGTSWISDDRGSVVEIKYMCLASDGASYIASEDIDLETGARSSHYPDPRARHLASAPAAHHSFPD